MEKNSQVENTAEHERQQKGQEARRATIAAFREFLRSNPNDYEAHLKTGQALEEQGELDEAEITYLKAINIEPQNYSAYIRLRDVLRQKVGDEGMIDKFCALFNSEKYNAGLDSLGIFFALYMQTPGGKGLELIENAITRNPKCEFLKQTLQTEQKALEAQSSRKVEN